MTGMLKRASALWYLIPSSPADLLGSGDTRPTNGPGSRGRPRRKRRSSLTEPRISFVREPIDANHPMLLPDRLPPRVGRLAPAHARTLLRPDQAGTISIVYKGMKVSFWLYRRGPVIQLPFHHCFDHFAPRDVRP